MHFIINEKVSFDVAERLVSSDKVRHTLSNPACRLLLILIENNNKIVTREELLQKVWSEFGLEPSGNSLNNNISILRKVLADFGIHDALKTVPRTGFEMSLEDIKVSAKSEDYLLVQSLAKPVKEKNKKWVLWATLCILIFTLIHVIHYFASDENFSDFSFYKKFQECSVYYNDGTRILSVSSFFQEGNGKQLLADCSSPASLYYDDSKVSKKTNLLEVFVAKCSTVKGGAKIECNDFVFTKKS